jgi:hypothetical protein
MVDIGSCSVLVQPHSKHDTDVATIHPAVKSAMPSNWSCSWPQLWEKTDFNCQSIIQFTYQEQALGFLRYGLYPYPGKPVFLEVENLETTPNNRLVEPVGRWLLWYATKASLIFCSATGDNALVILVSLTSAVRYYEEKVQMELVGSVTIAPGEDGYAFKFSRAAAQGFCQRQEQQWGTPVLINERTD